MSESIEQQAADWAAEAMGREAARTLCPVYVKREGCECRHCTGVCLCRRPDREWNTHYHVINR